MSLTKKNYIAIAEIIAKHNLNNDAINDFCSYFKSENSAFNEFTFRTYIQKVKSELVIKSV